MTSGIGRAVATTAVIGGGALAVGGIAGAVSSPRESQGTDLTLAVAGGVGLAGGVTALATTGRVGTVARIVALGATAVAGVAALAGLVGGTRRHEAAPTAPALAEPAPTPSPEPAATPSPTPAPAPTPTPGPTDPAPTPLTPKQGYEEAMARGRVRVDTVPETAASIGGSDAVMVSIHPRYSKVFRQALNERITPDVRVTGAVDWAPVANRVDADHDGAVTFDERMASGHLRAHSIAAYSAGVDEKVHAGGDLSPAARVRAGTQLLEEWNGVVKPGQSPGDSYMVAQTLLEEAALTRRPDDSADWKAVARHLQAKLTSYGG
ncbi:MAG: hypothetical protein JWL76_14 [Thermoleophilia bacterium]|nr:hypothetical protein [Thermoleophilia bacterium]